jgi:hypothetical protein
MHDLSMEPLYSGQETLVDKVEIDLDLDRKGNENGDRLLAALDEGYRSHYEDNVAGARAEQQFEFKLMPGVVVRGMIDVSFDTWFMEHKSTGSWLGDGAPYWKKLKGDSQLSTYFLGQASLTGKLPSHCVYNVIKRPNPSQMSNDKKVDEFIGHYIDEPEKVFFRKNIHRLEHELREFEDELRIYAADILRGLATGNHPRNPAACFDFGRTCEYYGTCWEGMSLDDDDMFYDSPLHPELDGE